MSLTALSAHTALPAPVVARPATAGRDTAVDVARAACLVVVVALHAMMVGVSESHGIPAFENAMVRWEWFPALTWVVQVMPLFFILGGFSSFLDWSRRRAAGENAGAYVVRRMRRLLVPAVAAVTATGVFVAALAVAGVAPEVVTAAGFHSSQPLWFLGVYILCTALVPTAVAAHQRAPGLTLGVLASTVLLVDLARAATGEEAIGFANLLFVWLLVQQLGFFIADGSVSRLGAARVGAVLIGALVVLGIVVSTGFWSADLFHALNPPTGALVLLGVAQLCAFHLLRPRLRALHARPLVQAAVAAIGSRAMTVYAWHMPVMIALAGLVLLLPGEPAVPLSLEWWLSRPMWLVAVAVAVAAVAGIAGRLERRPAGVLPRAVGTPATALIVAVGAGSVLVILASGGSVAGWLLGLTGLAVAVRSTRLHTRTVARVS